MFLKVFTSVKNLTEMVSKSEIFQVRKNITITIIIMINLEGRVPLLSFDTTRKEQCQIIMKNICFNMMIMNHV